MPDALEAARDETKAALSEAIRRRDERRRMEDKEIDALLAELRGLELAVARRGGHKVEPTPESDTAQAWRAMHRTDAILAILREHGKPAGPAEIARLLNTVGRSQDNPTLVGASLDHLKHRGRARAIARGKWVPTPDPLYAEKGKEGVA